MKILHLCPEGWQKDLEPAMEKLGYEFVTENPDIILAKSVTQLKKSVEAYRKYPNALKIQYNWDVYFWALNNPRKGEYDYKLYKEVCLMSDDVWTPSEAVRLTLQEVWNMDSKVMVSWCPQYPIPKDVEIKDGGYALQALRHNPDPHIDWYEKACKEVGINYRITWAKEMEESAYRKLLAEASFLVCVLYEMSTGGQFLSEGAALEKPILAPRSKYIGAYDYFGDTICYYEGGNYEDLKDKLKKMASGELRNDTKAAKKRILSMTPAWFAKKADKRIKELL